MYFVQKFLCPLVLVHTKSHRLIASLFLELASVQPSMNLLLVLLLYMRWKRRLFSSPSTSAGSQAAALAILLLESRTQFRAEFG